MSKQVFLKLTDQSCVMEVPNGVVIACIMGEQVSTVFVPGLRTEVVGSSEMLGVGQAELKAPCRMDYEWSEKNNNQPHLPFTQRSEPTAPTSYMDE